MNEAGKMTGSQQLALFGEAHQKMDVSLAPAFDEQLNANALLALSALPGVGFGTIRNLFLAEPDLTRLWNLDESDVIDRFRLARTPQPDQIARQFLSRRRELQKAGADRLRFYQARRTAILFLGSPTYPERLASAPNPPAWLFVQGDPALLSHPGITAVVGTRSPSEHGVQAARQLSVILAAYLGQIILSGLAEGIDAAAHRTAVDFRVPTIAVVGHGIDVTFPAATADLRHRLVDAGGAVVSEYLPGDTYTRERFVARNRIQAGLSRWVGVVEGQSRSGTAHTVRFARQAKRSIFGVRMGLPQVIPQDELLRDLEVVGDPVFDLSSHAGKDALVAFLEDPGRPASEADRPRVFSGLLAEIERLVGDYGATAEDFDYLVGQVERMRMERFNADSGGAPGL